MGGLGGLFDPLSNFKTSKAIDMKLSPNFLVISKEFCCCDDNCTVVERV